MPRACFGTRVLAVTALVLSLIGGRGEAATIEIVNLDAPGEGFNDPTPAAPVGGNPGTTIGAQRLFVFQYAADRWGALLPSDVVIRVEANFDPQTCDATSGVLGSAGPNTLHANFPHAPFANTWYHQALANRLAGSDLAPEADIGTTFNSSVGGPACLPQGWYYGVDGLEGAAIELLPVVLHELGHGLGFSTSTLAGVQEVFPHVYDRFLYDNTQNMHWHEMTDAQRAASAQNCQNLAWDGARVTASAPAVLGAKPVLRVNAPETLAGDYNVGVAAFGPPLTETGVTGDVVLVNDGMGVPTNGCEPLLNAAEVSGRIALVDRGGCPFVVKVKHAQDAGALAVIVADSAAGCPPAGLGGADPNITIPAVRVVQTDGVALESGLLSGLNASLLLDPGLRAGTDASGRVLVYTPAPFALGSSVSHWDTSPEPNLLMEPALNPSLSDDVDLALHHFADIGWFEGLLAAEENSAGASRLVAAFPNPARGAASLLYRLAREEDVHLAIYDLAGRRVRTVVEGRVSAGSHRARWDGRDDAGTAVRPGVYAYRLKTSSGIQSRHVVIVR